MADEDDFTAKLRQANLDQDRANERNIANAKKGIDLFLADLEGYYERRHALKLQRSTLPPLPTEAGPMIPLREPETVEEASVNDRRVSVPGGPAASGAGTKAGTPKIREGTAADVILKALKAAGPTGLSGRDLEDAVLRAGKRADSATKAKAKLRNSWGAQLVGRRWYAPGITPAGDGQ